MKDGLLLVSAILFWAFLHSALASLTFKEVIKNKFGENIFRYYRLIYNIFSGISLLPIFWLLFVIQDGKLYTIQKPWVTLNLLVQLFAILILIFGLKQTGVKKFIGLDAFQNGTTSDSLNLNTSGFYRYVRHPLYSAGLLFMWASPIMTINLLLITISLTLYIVIGALLEERKLIIEYGDIYLEYRKKVPMLIPRLIRNK